MKNNIFKKSKIKITIAVITVFVLSTLIYITFNKDNKGQQTNNNNQIKQTRQPLLSEKNREFLESMKFESLKKGEHPQSFEFYQEPKTKLLFSVFSDWEVKNSNENGVYFYQINHKKSKSSFDLIFDSTREKTRNKPKSTKVVDRAMLFNNDIIVDIFATSEKGTLKDNLINFDVESRDRFITSNGIKLDTNQTEEEFNKTRIEIEAMFASLGFGFPVPTSEMKPYLEPSIKNKSTPNRSPFGGANQEMTQINAGYKDPKYREKTGSEHYAIDLVPNEEYYKKNSAYSLTKQEIFFATCNGISRSYTDPVTKANVIEIKCFDKEHTVEYWHAKNTFTNPKLVGIGEVSAGNPIGIMGDTGASYGGRHLHYVVKKNGEYVDPNEYIK